MVVKNIAMAVSIFSLSTLGACAFKNMKGSITPETLAISYSPDQIGYKEVNDSVFTPNCIACHNQSLHQGSIVLDSYAAVKANLGLVQNQIVGQTMPPNGALAQDQINLVTKWIQAGAPELASDPVSTTPTPSTTSTPHPGTPPTPTPTSSPTPTTLTATYTSIRANIFASKCLSCHSAGSSESRYPLDVYANMMATSSMIVPGNPSSSTVYNQVSTGSMPPRGGNSLTSAEVTIIKTWIQNGAPE